MKKEELSDAMSYIEDELLEETNNVRSHPRGSALHARRYGKIVRFAAIAAAAALVVGIGYGTVSGVLNKSSQKKEAETIDMQVASQNAFMNDAVLSVTSTAAGAGEGRKSTAPEITTSDSYIGAKEGDNGNGDGYGEADELKAYEWVGKSITQTSCKADVTVFRNKENLYADGTWSLEMMKDDEWVEIYNCSFIDNTVFTNSDLNNISSTDTTTTFEQVFDWSGYGELASGTYRIFEMFYTFNGNNCENEYIPVEITFGITVD
ncbi:MAG: hypothetical protein J6Z46_02825 [Lachnospiraceae bacterium]|nr:hypothetical protein [Lachnospiraceae bacterium]